jgi:hypothetical protein
MRWTGAGEWGTAGTSIGLGSDPGALLAFDSNQKESSYMFAPVRNHAKSTWSE